MRAYGKVKVIHKDCNGTVVSEFSSHNMIVDQMMSSILLNALTNSAWTNQPIYRVGVGTGGYTGTVRNLPDVTWHDKTAMIGSLGSEDIDTITTSWDTVTHSLTIETETEIAANDYGATGVDVNEICLIAGHTTAGIMLGGGTLGVNDVMVAYTTIANQSMGVGDTFDLLWTIGFRKDVV